MKIDIKKILTTVALFAIACYENIPMSVAFNNEQKYEPRRFREDSIIDDYIDDLLDDAKNSYSDSTRYSIAEKISEKAFGESLGTQRRAYYALKEIKKSCYSASTKDSIQELIDELL